ncbi:MAG: HAMP domain-containing sensor histidine kinase [Sulfuritalea sp.]|nr:HAMP domain-containing sensor histidine kinase [Sulfuritalea sp.]
MKRFRLPLGSLRHKIVFGYGAIAVLVVGLSAFSLIEMRLLAEQITAGERIHQFLGVALEIRRFEKNYFLYGQRADLEENRAYVIEAHRILVEHGSQFAAVGSPQHIGALIIVLEGYERLMSAHVPGSEDAEGEARIRQFGKQIATSAEQWSRAERAILQTQLDRHRQWLLGSIAAVVLLVVVVGQMLAWRVARPLRKLEHDMAAVAEGRLAKLDLAVEDREIASLTRAFNHVLAQLETRQGQLVRSEKLAALGTLLSGVAHELNNPLSNISTSCEILAEEVGACRPAVSTHPGFRFAAGERNPRQTESGTAFQKDLIEQIDTETWRARRIVRSLLDYARDRAFRREAVPVAALVEESLRLVRGQIPAEVSLDVAVPADLCLSGDKQRLQQAIFNLVGNAVDALEGAGELHVAARPVRAPYPADALVFGQVEGERPRIEIEIRDNGHGIAADILPRIFDPFFTTKEVGRGLGLGLFIVFEIVEEHGGSIAVTSAPGQGTTFLIRLPAQETAS